MCLPLQTRFVLDGDIVAEHEHVHIVVQRAVGLSCGIGARDGDDRQIRLRQQLQRRFPVGRLRIFRRGGLRPALLLENSSVFFRITSISASSRSSATMTISFADACISSGVCRPLCIKMSLFAGVPIIMDAFCTPSIACMQFVRSISATES